MQPDKSTQILPLVPLRGATVFPKTSPTLDIGRRKSVEAVLAVKKGGKILLAPQLDESVASPKINQISSAATVAKIKNISRDESGALTVEFEALHRVKIRDFVQTTSFILASYETVPETNAATAKAQAFFRSILELISENGDVLRVDYNEAAAMYDDLNGFVDKVSSSLLFTKNIDLLEEFDTEKRLETLSMRLISEIEIVRLERKISIKVKQSIDRGQKEYFLREQMSAIQDELGEGKENNELIEKIRALPIAEEIKEKLLKDAAKNAKMPMSSPEYSITRNYLEFVIELPWGVKSEDNRDLKKAMEILDKEHFGLQKIKDRIVEFLAVHQLTEEKREPILCFVGPPGVGKTSIVRSIAQALDRKYIRMSVGGVRDEAEIRGHRKTYVGAMPGRIISNIKLAGTSMPVFLLDEIDKLSSDYRGDPASALLEVLDPEQNNTFRDNYLEIPFDLSDVIFITTANTADTIPPALLDRMEVIEMSGYTPVEKREIAVRHLYKKQLDANGLKEGQISFEDGLFDVIIEKYTRESGVRQLEKSIAQIMRKAARKIVEGETETVVVKKSNLSEFLGVPKYNR
ncbi:MAG TPA: AAA family ATPase, partial [Eubacteriales bacterium]|nr:AAA family ATPase [Eubacteriales bacterium]